MSLTSYVVSLLKQLNKQTNKQTEIKPLIMGHDQWFGLLPFFFKWFIITIKK